MSEFSNELHVNHRTPTSTTYRRIMHDKNMMCRKCVPKRQSISDSQSAITDRACYGWIKWKSGEFNIPAFPPRSVGPSRCDTRFRFPVGIHGIISPSFWIIVVGTHFPTISHVYRRKTFQWKNWKCVLGGWLLTRGRELGEPLDGVPVKQEDIGGHKFNSV